MQDDIMVETRTFKSCKGTSKQHPPLKTDNQNLIYKPPTPKQLEKCKITEQKIMKELYESDFHEMTWDKKCI